MLLSDLQGRLASLKVVAFSDIPSNAFRILAADATDTGGNRDRQQCGLGALPKTLLVHIPSNENLSRDHSAW